MEPEPNITGGDSGGAPQPERAERIKSERDVRLLRWLSKRNDWRIPETIYDETAEELQAFFRDPKNSARTRLMAAKLLMAMHEQNARIAVDSAKLVPADRGSDAPASDARAVEQIVPSAYLIPDRQELTELADVMREVGMLPGAPTDLEPGQ